MSWRPHIIGRYCYRIPDEYPLALAEPLLCAGITVYTPMMNQAGKSLGKAFGLNVTVFSTTISKREEALNVLGADKFVVSSDEEQMICKVYRQKYCWCVYVLLPRNETFIQNQDLWF